MTHIIIRPATNVPIEAEELVPWTVFVALLFLTVLYFIAAEQGAASLIEGEGVHEFVHDSRHLLGFPCN